MILGRGTASTDEAIITEFLQLLEETNSLRPSFIECMREAPLVMRRRIGKPILEWSDEEILALYAGQEKATWYVYNTFLTYLLFRGYHQASMLLVENMRGLSQYWTPILRPYREKIERTCQHLGYARLGTGTVLTLLLWLLCRVGKPLEELTRPDFERFREEYQRWYQEAKRFGGHPNAHVFRLERYLIEWRVIPPAPTKILRSEEHLASIRHQVFRTACLIYLNWSSVKHQYSTALANRRSLVLFFSWLEKQYPTCDRLDQVSRAMALSYAQFLKRLHEERQYSYGYWQRLYQNMRLFFAFIIEERVDTAPGYNPFSARDLPGMPDMLPRYFSDQEVRTIVHYAEQQASLLERTILITLLHTGIRAAELAKLKVSDLVQVAGKWKLHIHEGKGLKDRMIPLTDVCVRALQEWQQNGWEKKNDHLFTHYGQPWKGPDQIRVSLRKVAQKLGLQITPHRFRHTFAVALLNYGVRESALQKIMGHTTLNMTLEYARILDRSVEQAFSQAIEEMQEGPRSWIPSFFAQEDSTLFAEGDTISWIQLPVGFCRRNPKLHCESDVKCFLCDRFCATPKDLPRLQQMYERFTKLGLGLKAEVVAAQIQQLQEIPQNSSVLIPTTTIKRAERS